MKKITILLAILFLSPFMVLAQSLITGKVVDASTGEPISFASVFEKNTKNATATLDDGTFSLKVKPEATLVISFIGYANLEVQADSKKQMLIQLTPESTQLDEVMIVAYGVTTKASYTGSAQSVKSDDLLKSRSESIDKALSGKVSGVRSTSATGDPGSSGDIQIRGIGSITGSTAPLYVVDGVPVTSGEFGSNSSNILSTLNPEDIESLTILKDAAAASLYGSRAANGVVIINTKKGKAGEVVFSAKVNIGVTTVGSDSYMVMNGQEYVDYSKDALFNNYLLRNKALLPTDKNYNNPDILAGAKTFSENKANWGNTAANKNWNVAIDDPNVSTNWRDKLFQTGLNQEYAISAQGGSEKLRFYAGLGYNDISSYSGPYDFKRFTGTVNLSVAVKKWLDLEFKTQLSYTDQNGYYDKGGQASSITYFSQANFIIQSNPTSAYSLPDGTLNPNTSWNSNLINFDLLWDKQTLRTKTYRALANAGGTVKFTDKLKFKTTNSIDAITLKTYEYWSPDSPDGASTNGWAGRMQNTINMLTTSNILSYDNTFAKKHKFNAMVGYEAQLYQYEYLWASSNDFSTEKLPELSTGKPKSANSSFTNNYMRSFLSSINYSYDGRYFAAVSLRGDESSRLGADNRLGMFWSVSASWRFKQEKFLKDVAWLTDGKIRASYGTNGKLPGGSYEHLGLYSFTAKYADESAIYPSQPLNKDLGWEKSRNFNIGIDFSIFQRFGFSVEYFNKYTTDLLMNVPVSWVSGYGTALQNNGEISNRGVEFEFHAKDIVKSEVVWDMDFNLGTLKATVEKLADGADVFGGHSNFFLYSEGKDLNTFYLPKWYGVDPKSGLAQFYKDPTKDATADNLTFLYSEAKKGEICKAYPSVSGGFSNTVSWKGFSLSFLLTYQFGGNMFDYPGYFTQHYGFRMGSMNLSKELVGNTWKHEGDEARFPKPVKGWSNRPDNFSSNIVKSTDFIRLKELSLTYSLPKKAIQAMRLKNLDINISANNVAFLYRATKYVDPEVALNGYRSTDIPLPRTISLGLNIGF